MRWTNIITNKMKLDKLKKSKIQMVFNRNFCDTSAVLPIRNIGILSHVDAGKTTTTERMLFYSGAIRSLGEVHHGNTVTDFLAQERERGITICSSAVTFMWKDHRINIIDTPGHIDFTMEVEQSLSALDGCVVILDSVRGVEAQTVTVWSQSDRYNLPKIVFLNKMDRPNIDFEGCLSNISQKLDVIPQPVQLPIYDDKSRFTGIANIITLRQLLWNSESLGSSYKDTNINDPQILKSAIQARTQLIETLSNFDEVLAEKVILSENYYDMPLDIITTALRKATLSRKLVPVLIGSAYKNIAIQPLMDAVIEYIPPPKQLEISVADLKNNFIGKVVKIMHDKRQGPLNLVRIFNGNIKKGARINNIRGEVETVQQIYEPLGNEYKEINNAGIGNIVFCSGLQNTITGDVLLSSEIFHKYFKNIEKTPKTIDEIHEDVAKVVLLKPSIPDAVYFCSIETSTVSQQKALNTALKQLQREDPSLRVVHNEKTDETILGGMGELHLEIIKSRLLTEYKLKVHFGSLQIGYKEAIREPFTDSLCVEKNIGGRLQKVEITISVTDSNKKDFSLDNSPEAMVNLKLLKPQLIQNIRKGCLSAFERGPKVGGQVINTQIVLHNVRVGRQTADSFLMAIATQCVQKILSEVGTQILEPIMALEIIVPSEKMPLIMGDLGKRRAAIEDVKPKGTSNKIINVTVPLAEIIGYSTVLRALSSGTAYMSLKPAGYWKMTPQDEIKAIQGAQFFV